MLLLRATGALFLLPFAYFLRYSDKNAYECALGGLLVLTVALAQLFWQTPTRNSTLHRVDAAAAKMSLVCFIAYTLARKLPAELMASYCAVLAGVVTAAALSQHYSCRDWGGARHIRAHAALHALCAIGAFYAFLDTRAYTSHAWLSDAPATSFSPAYPTGLQ